MVNIVINNYCNQKCPYCFAYENMKNKELKKDMDLWTYIKILHFLKKNKETEVRILWWEPTISPNIRKFLKIANKWWFDIIIFSNINIDNQRLKDIFKWFNWIRINCNINDKKFYNEKQLKNIDENIETLNKLWLKTIIWYNITNIKQKPNFIFSLAKKHNISAINLKITNSSLWWKLIIDNSSKELWEYIFETIEKYHKDFFIEISCWLDKNIFSEKQLKYIEKNTRLNLKFWCNWNIWKFEINTDWSIFKCYPLKKLFKDKSLDINQILKNNTKIEDIINSLNNKFKCNWECTSNKMIKKSEK